MAEMEDIRIGPFVGGLNTASDPTSIGDTDLAIMDNLELDPDGTLVSRPPVVNLNTPAPSDLTTKETITRTNMATNSRPLLDRTNWHWIYASDAASSDGSGYKGVPVFNSDGGPSGLPGKVSATLTAPLTASFATGYAYYEPLANSAGVRANGSVWVRFSKAVWIDVSLEFVVLPANYLTNYAYMLAYSNINPTVSVLGRSTTRVQIQANIWTRVVIPTIAATGSFTHIRMTVLFVGGSNTGVAGDVLEASQVTVEVETDVPGDTIDGVLPSRILEDGTELKYRWVPSTNRSEEYRSEIVQGTASLRLIGYYVAPNGETYLVGNNGKETYYYEESLGRWSKICEFPAASCTQYRDKLWLVPPTGNGSDGGSWSISAGFASVSSMPKGEAIVTHKERLWVAAGPAATQNGSRLYYSDVGDPTNWTGGSSGFLSINAGDGQNIAALFVYFNDILIFKTRSTWRYSYSTDPANGVVSIVSATVGASSAEAVVAHDNVVFVTFGDKVYEMANYNFTRINNKVPLVSRTYRGGLNTPVSTSVWADRLIVNYFGTTFVYGLRTETWSQWTFNDPEFVLGGVKPIPVTYQNQTPAAYAYSAFGNNPHVYKVSDEVSVNAKENMTCVIETKNYDYMASHAFKRLLWWGIDVVLRSGFRAYVTPIVYNVPVTWEQLEQFTWESREQYTWSRSMDKAIQANDGGSSDGTSGDRKFIKLLKSLRFRQVTYRLEFDTDGSSSTAPFKLFSLTTRVGVKQRLTAKVS